MKVRKEKKQRSTPFGYMEILKYERKKAAVRNTRKIRTKSDMPFSKTFILGSMADLLYEIKNLAQTTSQARSRLLKNESIEKVRALLFQYHKSFGSNYSEIIRVFAYDTFKNSGVSDLHLRKISSVYKT